VLSFGAKSKFSQKADAWSAVSRTGSVFFFFFARRVFNEAEQLAVQLAGRTAGRPSRGAVDLDFLFLFRWSDASHRAFLFCGATLPFRDTPQDLFLKTRDAIEVQSEKNEKKKQ
jgi:hypothetical protein